MQYEHTTKDVIRIKKIAKKEERERCKNKLKKYLKIQVKTKNGIIQVPEIEIDQIIR